MSAGSVFSVMLTLAVVLGVMGVALKLLRKYTLGGSARNGAVNMEVLQRVTLGQRQGIAVVRIGTRVLAVSMGDGGVHPVAELDPSDVSNAGPSAISAAVTTAVTAAATQGMSKVTESLRTLTLHKTPAVTVAADKPEAEPNTTAVPQRISYVAPMEDFQAVLNMAMSGAARS